MPANSPPKNVTAASNTIGGTEGVNSMLNLISENGGNGISLLGSGVTGTVIQGNYIGTDITGLLDDRGNSNDGIYIDSNNGQDAPTKTTIGGPGANAGNVISGNYNWGIQADNGTTGSLQNNLVGYDVNGGDLVNLGGGESLPANGWTSNEKVTVHPIWERMCTNRTQAVVENRLKNRPSQGWQYFDIRTLLDSKSSE